MDHGKLLETFIAEALELIEDLEVDLVALEGSADDELINRIFRAAHTIKGSAGVVGLTALSEFTHTMENVLDLVRSGGISATSELVSVLLRAVDVIRTMVRVAVGDAGVVDKREVQFVVDMLGQFLPGDTGSEAAGVPAGQKAAVQGEKVANAYFEITMKLGDDLFETGTDPLMLLHELSDIGEIVEIEADASRLPDFHALDVHTLYLDWRLVVRTTEPFSRIENIFIFVQDNGDISIEDVTQCFKDGVDMRIADKKIGEILTDKGIVSAKDVDEVLASQKKIGELLVQAGKVSEEALRQELDKQLKSREIQKSTTIRVDTDKLDKLVNLVGEMVIAVARVDQQYGSHSVGKRGTNGAMESLQRITRELQEQVMRVRMVPVEGLFGRFHRVVRDTAADLSKSVRLELKGTETELDKNVIEELSDPLKHLIRNSVDHGIESPEERIAAGKPEVATVKLLAYQQEGTIFIEISDDGRGIDRQAVLHKAIEKGVIQEADSLSDQEIYQLLFAPGFSTAKRVTEVSGRGVGLDVVKRNIDKLKGSIEVISAPGEGSTFKIRLPLTLAIIDGMNVRVGEEILTVPLISIIESIRPDREAVKTVVGQGEVVNARGEFIPLVRLHDLFNIETDKIDPSQALVMIVESSQRKFGLLVDDMLGQQQAVIKSLDKNFRQIDGTAGATILGDGSVSLILDIHGLEKMAFESLDANHVRSVAAEAA